MDEVVALPCRHSVLRNPRYAAWVAAAGVLLLIIGMPFAGLALGLLAALGTAVVALAMVVKGTRLAGRRRVGGAVKLERDAIRVSGAGQPDELVVRLDQIESGYETGANGTVVLNLRDGAQLSLALERDTTARLLTHAGVALEQRALTLPLRGTIGAFTIGFASFWPFLFGAMAIAGELVPNDHGSAFLLGLVLAAVSTALTVMRLGFPRIVVGTDGFRILGVLRRFIPYEKIARVELVAAQYAHGSPSIRVHLHTGRTMVLPTISAPTERVEGLARRIHDAARVHAGGAARRLDALARGGRSIAAWKNDLERLALAPPGFRDNALGRDDFERVLADAAAPPDQRIGAAVALRAMDPSAAPARIRIAADASADDALREALASAAEGEIDDAQLEQAGARKALR